MYNSLENKKKAVFFMFDELSTGQHMSSTNDLGVDEDILQLLCVFTGL